MYGKSIFVFCLIFFSNYAADYQIPKGGVYLGTETATGKPVFQFPEYFIRGHDGVAESGTPTFPIIPPNLPVRKVIVQVPMPVLVLDQESLSRIVAQDRLLAFQQQQLAFQQHQIMQQEQQLAERKNDKKFSGRKKKQTSKNKTEVPQKQITILKRPEQGAAAQNTEVAIAPEIKNVAQHEVQQQKLEKKEEPATVPTSAVPETVTWAQAAAVLSSQPQNGPVKLQAAKETTEKRGTTAATKNSSNSKHKKPELGVKVVEKKSVDSSCGKGSTVVSPKEMLKLAAQANAVIVSSSGVDAQPGNIQMLAGSQQSKGDCVSSKASAKKGRRTGASQASSESTVSMVIEDLDKLIADAKKKDIEKERAAQEEKEKKDQQEMFDLLWLVGAYEKIKEMSFSSQILSPAQKKQFNFVTTLNSPSEKSLDQKVRSVIACKETWTKAFQTLKQDSKFNALYNGLLTGQHDGNSYPFFTLVQSVLHVFAYKMAQQSPKFSIYIPPVTHIEERKKHFVKEYVGMLQKVCDEFTGTEIKDFSFLTPEGSINLSQFLALADCGICHRGVWLTMKSSLSVLAHQSSALSIVVHAQSEQLSLSSPLSSFVISAFKNLKSYLNPVETKDTFPTVLNQGRLFLIALLGSHLSKKIETQEGFSEENENYQEKFKEAILMLFDKHASDENDERRKRDVEQLHLLCFDYENVRSNIFATKNIADLIHEKASSVVSTIKVLQTNKSDVTILDEAASYFESRAVKPYYN